MFLFQKKAITGLIVISLLLVATVGTFFYLQGWFVLYEDEFELLIEAKDFESTIEIQKVDGTTLTLNNNYKDNLEIDSIKINSISCPIATDLEVDKGIAAIDIGGCSSGLQELNAYEVSIVTPQGVKSEDELLRNIPNDLLIALFTSGTCDIAGGYTKIYGLSALDNAHAEISSSSTFTYNLCLRHLSYTIGTESSGTNILYTINQSNSPVFTNQGSIYQTPDNWYNISISSSGGTISFVVNSSDMSSLDYTCIGKIDEDNVYGSHIGNCASTLPDTLWLKIE